MKSRKKKRIEREPEETETRGPSTHRRRLDRRNQRRNGKRIQREITRDPHFWQEQRGNPAQREEEAEEDARGWWGEFDDVKSWYEKD